MSTDNSNKFAKKFAPMIGVNGAGSEIININTVIATDKLLKDYPNPSTDINNPTPVGHQYSFMIASGAALDPTGSGTGDLSFGAAIGDIVRFTAVSEYNQFRQSVVMYDMFRIKGDEVFQDDNFMLRIAENVETPFPVNFENFETISVQEGFYWGENSIKARGSEFYGLRFAVYQLERGEQYPKLKGYFQWDPEVHVVG